MATDANRGGGAADNPQTGVSWLDPRTVLALARPTPRTVALSAGVVTKLLPADPQRVAFIVSKGVSLPAFPRIGPGPDADVFWLRADATVDVRTFTLQDWLSTIVGEWYVLSADPGSVRVYEFRSPA